MLATFKKIHIWKKCVKSSLLFGRKINAKLLLQDLSYIRIKTSG